MNKYDLVLITTHQNEANIYNLIDGVYQNNKIKVLLLVISQDCKIEFTRDDNFNSMVFINVSKMGLSKARNIGLKYLLDSNICSEYIMFPDDDTTFDLDFFYNFNSILGSNKCFIIPIYKNGTKDSYLGKLTAEGALITLKEINLIGSPNQVVLYDKHKDKIYFDEKLGVGAKLGSSEDLDFFLRFFYKGIPYWFTKKIYNYHPKKTDSYKNSKLKTIINRFKGYSSGYAFIIMKYELYGMIPKYIFRTFVAFIFFAIQFRFKLSYAYLVQFFWRIIYIFKFYIKKSKK